MEACKSRYPGLEEALAHLSHLHLRFDIGLALNLTGGRPDEWYRSLQIQQISDIELLWNLGVENVEGQSATSTKTMVMQALQCIGEQIHAPATLRAPATATVPGMIHSVPTARVRMQA